MTRTNTPTPRLRSCPVGATVRLAGVERELTVKAIRADGYIDLTYRGHLAVTASAGHELEQVK